jgi:hypothetical protein
MIKEEFPQMHKRLTQVILSASAAALAISLGATTASATTASTWTVTPGGAWTASGSAQVKDTTTGTVAKCTSLKMAGTLKSGSGLAGAKISTITSGTFSGCTIATIGVTVTSHGFPWYLNATSYNSSTGTTTGTITGIDLTATGPGCAATLDGTAAGADNGTVNVTYSNSTHVLTLLASGGNLHSWGVTGCFGLINNGDAQQASGSVTVSPGQTITSP